jgi:sulfide:quinone oxidoreductase
MSITWIAPDFAVSPQLRVEQLSEIAAAGYCGIVNNRPDREGPDQPTSDAIETEARLLGLDYAYIPIVPGEMSEAHVRALDRFLQQVEGPVLAFCRTGNRSAQLWKLAREAA